MAVTLKRTATGVDVWLSVVVGGRQAFDAEDGILVGSGEDAGTALTDAVEHLEVATETLAAVERGSAVEEYKRREWT